jgi:glycosyltransferase involved in cell wall biosynthesis
LQKLLFVGHDATATGAPIFLLNFIKWVTINHPEIDIDVILLNRGSLYHKYGEFAPTYVYNKRIQLIDKILNYCEEIGLIGRRKEEILKSFTRPNNLNKIKANKYDALFFNSFASAVLIPHLAKHFNCKIICRAPELTMVATNHCGEDAIKKAIPYINQYIAVSNMVKKFYISELGINKEKITVIPGFSRFKGKCRKSKNEMRARLDISKDEFVVLGSGTVDWRKGVDSFIKIASLVKTKQNKKNIKFIWIGGYKSGINFKQAVYDIEKLGLQGMVCFLGHVDNVEGYLLASDVYALTSREDPMPLSAIEAARFGLPIICYNNASGISDFLNDETGICVNYLDENQFAKEVIKLVNNQPLVTLMSQKIKEKSYIFDKDVVSKNIFELISKCQELKHR